MLWLIIFIIAIIVSSVVFIVNKKKSIIKIEEDKLKKQGWIFSQTYLNSQQGFIIVDENRQEVACFNLPEAFMNETLRRTRIFKFEDILSCEILKDGTPTYRKSTSRTNGAVLYSGSLFGSGVAVNGGTSNDIRKNVKITGIVLKLVVKDLQEPTWLIPFLHLESSIALPNATNEANKWKDIFSIIIDSVDKIEKDKQDTKVIVQNSPTMINGDIYEQLQKIADLKDKGILTEDEFIAQKSKILA